MPDPTCACGRIYRWRWQRAWHLRMGCVFPAADPAYDRFNRRTHA